MMLSDSPHSTDESVHQGGEGHKFLAQQTITAERTKGWVTNVLLAINIVALIAMLFMWRHASQEADLMHYDLDVYMTRDIGELKAQVKSDHDLIQAYGLQHTVEEAVKKQEKR